MHLFVERVCKTQMLDTFYKQGKVCSHTESAVNSGPGLKCPVKAFTAGEKNSSFYISKWPTSQPLPSNRNGHNISSMSVLQNLESWNGSDGWEPIVKVDTFLHLESFNSCIPHVHFSPLQPSHHCSIMWHLISWTPRAQWSPNHLKLVTVYVLMLLVSLSFASGQSRPFKHQIDNRSKYEPHRTWWPHSFSCTEG